MNTSEGVRPIPETPGEPPRSEERILNALRRLIRAADMDSRRLAEESDVTGPQLLCLMAIVDHGPITATEIARHVHVSASTVIGILDRLEQKGLAQRERDDEDRRLVHVEATPDGRALVARTPYPLQSALSEAFRNLSAEEQESMAATMERLVSLVGADALDDEPPLEVEASARRLRR